MVLKYRNKKTVFDGITFDSKAEADYYHTLKIFKMAGEIEEIAIHPKFVLQPAYRKCCGHVWLDKPPGYIKGATICGNCRKKMPKTSAITYSADFKVTWKGGKVEVIDVKGMETKAFKDKRKMFEFQYPHLTLNVVRK